MKITNESDFGEPMGNISVDDTFDSDGELEIGISSDERDVDVSDIYIYLNKEKVQQLVDHLMEVLNK